MEKKFLLTAGRSPITLDLARQLRGTGHRVFVVDTSSSNIARFSNAVEKAFSLPSPRFNPEGYLQAIVQIVKEYQIDQVIPIWEDNLVIARGIDQFPKECHVTTSSFDLLHTLHNKWTFYQKMCTHAIPVPKTELVTSKEITFKCPFALKKCYTRAAQEVIKINEGDEIPDLPISPDNPWIAQEWIEGQRYCSYTVCHQGKITAYSLYPVEYAINGHSCLNFRYVDHPKVFEWISSFVAKEKVSGQVCFDFIEREGTLYVIECNPRATSGVHLFKTEDHLANAFLNPDQPLITPRKNTQKQILMGMLLYGWLSPEAKRDQSRFWKTLFHTPDVVFSTHDLCPAFAQFFLLPYYVLKSHQWNVRIPAAFTYDLDFCEKR